MAGSNLQWLQPFTQMARKPSKFKILKQGKAADEAGRPPPRRHNTLILHQDF
jgi:hypothetical protein